MIFTLYTFDDGCEGTEDTFETQNKDEAQEYARTNKKRLIANEYRFADSEVLEDNTERTDEDGETQGNGH